MAVRAACGCRTVQRALYVDQAREGRRAIRAVAETMEYLLFAAMTHAEDGALAVSASAVVVP